MQFNMELAIKNNLNLNDLIILSFIELQVDERGINNECAISYSEIINYNPSLEKDNKREFDNRNLEGYNFICRSSGIEYLTQRKARKIIENHDVFTRISVDIRPNAKNNGNNFELTQIEKDLAKKLVS